MLSPRSESQAENECHAEDRDMERERHHPPRLAVGVSQGNWPSSLNESSGKGLLRGQRPAVSFYREGNPGLETRKLESARANPYSCSLIHRKSGLMSTVGKKGPSNGSTNNRNSDF